MKYSLRALKYLLNYLPVAIGGGIALILVNVANLITPQVLRYLIDQGITPLDMNKVWLAAGALVVVAFVRGFFNFLQGYWGEVASQGVAFDMRNTYIRKAAKPEFLLSRSLPNRQADDPHDLGCRAGTKFCRDAAS